MSTYRDKWGRCEHCGRPVVDDTTDFGNGLMLRTTCGGIEFRIERVNGTLPGASWTPGMTRSELLHFLGVVPAEPMA